MKTISFIFGSNLLLALGSLAPFVPPEDRGNSHGFLPTKIQPPPFLLLVFMSIHIAKAATG